ncbi:alpha/beta hydrolase [Bacillus sonorensis]|uniref:alpha/beta hydrolase n=1 Tax=Bacillus sonorensis TaxID=119858 RepID=UPI00227E9642|nr:alpha/beta hydrolase [Bacillus sonorensis]MCY8272257.1 alpha/beta hydrolase [Bacillus sonorensis]MCY8605319.1 alpha/beta hydrolase [Bacillus sonorensis]
MFIWLAVLGAVAALLVLALGLYFTNQIMYIKKRTDQFIIERETADGHYAEEEFKALPKEEITLTSAFGYDIKGYYVHPHRTKNTVIICHGVTMNLLNSVKYMNLFLELGWNAVIYDHRRHGMSGGKTTSYGYYEKEDLKTVVDWLRERNGEQALIGIHGESMGAVTTLLYAGMADARADFYVADCPFATFEDQLLYRLKEDFRLPGTFILPLADLFLKWRDGYRIGDVSPLAVIDQVKQPVLFIHSKDDDYIPVQSSEMLYEKKTGNKQLYIAKKGAHAMSYTHNRDSYKKAVQDFLRDITANMHKKSEQA